VTVRIGFRHQCSKKLRRKDLEGSVVKAFGEAGTLGPHGECEDGRKSGFTGRLGFQRQLGKIGKVLQVRVQAPVNLPLIIKDGEEGT